MGMSPAQELNRILTVIDGMMTMARAVGHEIDYSRADTQFAKDIKRAVQLSRIILNNDPERDEDD